MARAFADTAVKAVFDAYPDELRAELLALRQLIFETAGETNGVGPLTETLKWGQPAYLTLAPKTGSTIRIHSLKGEPARFALFIHCQTRLMEMFLEHYPSEFEVDGKRALRFEVGKPVPEAAIKHCIAMALTYHITK
jgi:hypothetical protein